MKLADDSETGCCARLDKACWDGSKPVWSYPEKPIWTTDEISPWGSDSYVAR